MKDSRHNYKMSDIRKCFSTVGDTTLSKWIDKSLIPHQRAPRGIRNNISYSALEIVHVGVLTLLSTWGVLTYYKDASISVFGGYVSLENRLFFTPAELAVLPPDAGNFNVSELSLTEPAKMVDYYSSHGPNLKMIVTSWQVPVEQEDKRMRRTKTVFDIGILTNEQAEEWEQDQIGLRPEIQEIFPPEPIIWSTNKDGAESYKRFGFLKIDVDRIIGHVYNQLDITSLLD